MFSDVEKLKEFITRRQTLKEMLKEFFHQEGKYQMKI